MSYIHDALMKSQRERDQASVPTLQTDYGAVAAPRKSNDRWAYTALGLGALAVAIAIYGVWGRGVAPGESIGALTESPSRAEGSKAIRLLSESGLTSPARRPVSAPAIRPATSQQPLSQPASPVTQTVDPVASAPSRDPSNRRDSAAPTNPSEPPRPVAAENRGVEKRAAPVIIEPNVRPAPIPVASARPIPRAEPSPEPAKPTPAPVKRNVGASPERSSRWVKKLERLEIPHRSLHTGSAPESSTPADSHRAEDVAPSGPADRDERGSDDGVSPTVATLAAVTPRSPPIAVEGNSVTDDILPSVAPAPALVSQPASGPKAPSLFSLPSDVRSQIPLLRINAHVYAAEVRSRMVIINMRRYGEREQTNEGPMVEAITPFGAELSHAGHRFHLPLP
ncbi:MAG: general secretion pathway protein GspB [Pseudomonadota bacterium]